MARITLLEKWNALEGQLKLIKSNILDNYLKSNNIPKYEQIYEVDRLGNITSKNVIKYSVLFELDGRFKYTPSYEKRPTKKDLESLQNYIDNIYNYDIVLYIDYRYDNCSGSYKYNDIINSEHMSFCESDLFEKAEKNKELYAPKEGYSPCAYCGKQVKTESMISAKIFGRDRKQVWDSWKKRYVSKAYVTEHYLKFCSGKCAGNEQMSREG